MTTQAEYKEMLAWATDGDEDGYAPRDGDCDDEEPAVNPGATERWYDGVDGDCAGDDDYDVDVDGVTVDADCDDNDDDIFPDADEVCNGVDDDCDGAIDEGLSATWFRDADGDGQGSNIESIEICLAPAGYVATSGDCDDYDVLVYQGAAEICGDGVVNDCDADESGCRLTGTWAVTDLGVSLDGGALIGAPETGGWPGVEWVYVPGEAGGHVFVSAPRAPSGAADDGWVYRISATEFTGESFDVVALATIQGEREGERFGGALAGPIQLTGLDTPHVAIGGGWSSGESELVFVPTSIEGIQGASEAATATVSGSSSLLTLDVFAQSAVPTLAVGLPGDQEVHLLTAVTDGGELSQLASATWTSQLIYDQAGASVCARSDVNGDGLSDLVVGAPGLDGRGGVFLVLGASTGGDLSDADAVLLGEASGGVAGTALACGVDLDDDGLADVLVGDPESVDGANAVGRAYGVVASDWTGDGLQSAWLRISSEQDGARLGEKVALGDVDGDDHADVVVGAPKQSEAHAGGGGVYVFYGPVSASVARSQADLAFGSESGGDQLGSGLLTGVDVDGDGADELYMGAKLRGSSGERRGALYLLYGQGD